MEAISNHKMKNEIGLVMVLAMIICLSMLTSVQSVNVASVVTPAFFNSIKNQASSTCRGKTFYTRAAFLSAARTFPNFGNTGTNLAAMREIAAFYAHVTHETGHFCFIDEIGAANKRYCDLSCRNSSPCRAHSYHGRGPIQLTWNCNYGACGRDLGLDLLNHPELVSTNPIVSFKTALWYWMKRVHPVMNKGFGATIQAINAGECNGGRPAAVQNRLRYYLQYCRRFGITPGLNLNC